MIGKLFCFSIFSLLISCSFRSMLKKQEKQENIKEKVCIFTSIYNNQTRLMKKSIEENLPNTTNNINECNFLLIASIIKNTNDMYDMSGSIFASQIRTTTNYSIFETNQESREKIKQIIENEPFGRNADVGRQFNGIGTGAGSISRELTNQLDAVNDKFSRDDSAISGVANKIFSGMLTNISSFKTNPSLLSSTNQDETDANENLGRKIGEDLANELIIAIESIKNDRQKK